LFLYFSQKYPVLTPFNSVLIVGYSMYEVVPQSVHYALLEKSNVSILTILGSVYFQTFAGAGVGLAGVGLVGFVGVVGVGTPGLATAVIVLGVALTL